MKYVNTHTHTTRKDNDVLEIINMEPHQIALEDNFHSIGLHPWYIEEDNINEELEIVKNTLILPNCLAVGECGLDNKVNVSQILQEQVFSEQLRSAQLYNKPIIIHCVAAFDKMLGLKKKFRVVQPMVVHGFCGSYNQAEILLKHGFYLSFGKSLFLNDKLKSYFPHLPIERIFLETDTDTRTIQEVYELAAELKQMPADDLKCIIWHNLNNIVQNEASKALIRK